MAILKGVEIWFAKVDPARPNAKFNKKNPTWEVQLRTTDKVKKKEWEALNLPVKAVVPDEGEPYFRLNLRKKSIKADGEASSPVSILNGHLEAVDPKSIGNGSIGNVRIYQYEYPKEGGGKGIATVLMGIQLTTHIMYQAKPRDDDFGMEDYDQIAPEDTDDDDGNAY